GEHAAGGGAGAHRDRPLRLQHLVVEAADDRRHLDRDAARQDYPVGLAGGGAQGLGAEAGEVVAGGDDRDRRLDRAAGEAEGEREDRVGPRQVQHFLERGRDDPLFNVALEVLTLEVAAEHVAGGGLLGQQRVAFLYFQSNAPFRQT